MFIINVFGRILGNRVSDLERKLKTYEVSGLWNIQGDKKLLKCCDLN